MGVQPQPRMGRPPAGLNGAAVTTYPQLSLRLPPQTIATLHALGVIEHRAMWRIIMDALAAYDSYWLRDSRPASAQELPPLSPRFR